MNRRKRSSRTGGLLLWKPRGISSRRALEVAQGALAEGPLGHTGTLDPLAEGLLLLLGGEARKFQSILTDHTKSYRAEVTFGVCSQSEDAEGPLYSPIPRGNLPTSSEVEAALEQFRGGYEQIPPGHSAVRVDGQRAWKRARRGETFTLPARSVEITTLKVADSEAGRDGVSLSSMTIDVDCGSGTYIRSLARDLGAAIGCGAYLSGLVRTRLGGLEAEAATPLEEVHPGDWMELEEVVAGLPRIEVDAETRDRLSQGQRVPLAESHRSGDGRGPFAIWCSDLVVGIGELRGSVIQPRRWLDR